MPIIMLVLATIGGAIWFWVRNNPRDALDVAQDAAVTLKNAPRRLSFRRSTNQHPVDAIEDPIVLVGVIAQCFVSLDDLPTKDQYDLLHVKLRAHLRCSEEDAQEMQVFGRWIADRCGGPDSAVPRLSRRLRKVDDTASWGLLQRLLDDVVSGELSTRQSEAIADLAREFNR